MVPRLTYIFPVWDHGILSHCTIINKECLKHTVWLNSYVLLKLSGNSRIDFEIERFTRRNCSWRKGLQTIHYFPSVTLFSTSLTWKLYGPILRMWFNCLKAAKSIRGNTKSQWWSLYSFSRPSEGWKPLIRIHQLPSFIPKLLVVPHPEKDQFSPLYARTLSYILRFVKWVQGIAGDLMLKSDMSRNDCKVVRLANYNRKKWS